jgi:hypothetical protein
MEDQNFDAEYAAEVAEVEADRQRKAEPPPVLDQAEFLAWRSPRTVQQGPVRLDNPLWHWLVRTRHSAYSANDMFAGPSTFETGPMWCFDRMGMSKTLLPDGRVVYIGGEHEDHYDPDFFIYNDVTAVDTDGSIAVHGYAREEFPPTDFHSATLVGNAIFIIGCLGYPEQRVEGRTTVFRLELKTMAITPVETSGVAPGWIHRHAAELGADGSSIVIRGGELWLGSGRSMQENIDAWSLNVANGHWTRLSQLNWQRWTMRRVDRKPNRLWDLRQELWRHEHGWEGQESYWKHDDAPDFDALAALYRLDAGAPSPEEGPGYNVFRIVIDSVVVKFTEERWLVHAMVEGHLSDERLADLQRTTLATLQRLDASDWEIEAK